MNFQTQPNLVSLIMFTLSTLVYPSPEVFAKDGLLIKVDEVMALNPSKQSPYTEGLIAWKYGAIYHLNPNLKVIKKILENDELTIRKIIQVSSSLFILTNSDIKNKEGEIVDSIDSIIEYDLSKGLIKSRWSNPNYSIWSIASDDKAVFVMLFEGEQFKLTSNGFQKVTDHHDRGHFIPTNKQEPIICTDPIDSKHNGKPSICFRNGEFNWKKKGPWGTLVTPPFICNNFLIENVRKYERAAKSDKLRAFVSDISTGKQLETSDVENTSPLSCIGAEIIYASNSSIILRKLPTLEVTHTLKTTSKEINSVTMIDDSVYWVDEKRTIHKMQLQR